MQIPSRRQLLGGLAAAAPDAETHTKVTTLKNVKEFIIDRSAPRVSKSARAGTIVTKIPRKMIATSRMGA